MKTYLGFKRTVVDKSTGAQSTEMKFIPVDLPSIDAKDGWKLVGSSDSVFIVPEVQEETVEQLSIPECVVEQDPIPAGATFESPEVGTARLVRLKNEIKITWRRGKKTANQTSPNSVCISELNKNQFFADCRRAFGQSTDYFRFSTTDAEYKYWNEFIDREYARQLAEANHKLRVG